MAGPLQAVLGALLEYDEAGQPSKFRYAAIVYQFLKKVPGKIGPSFPRRYRKVRGPWWSRRRSPARQEGRRLDRLRVTRLLDEVLAHARRRWAVELISWTSRRIDITTSGERVEGKNGAGWAVVEIRPAPRLGAVSAPHDAGALCTGTLHFTLLEVSAVRVTTFRPPLCRLYRASPATIPGRLPRDYGRAGSLDGAGRTNWRAWRHPGPSTSGQELRRRQIRPSGRFAGSGPARR